MAGMASEGERKEGEKAAMLTRRKKKKKRPVDYPLGRGTVGNRAAEQ